MRPPSQMERGCSSGAVRYSAAPDEQGPLRTVQQLQGLRNRILVRSHDILRGRLGRIFYLLLLYSQVEGFGCDLQKDGTGAAGDSLAEGRIQVLGYPMRLATSPRPLDHRFDHALLVHILQGALVKVAQGYHAADDHDGDVLHIGSDHAGEGIGEPGTRGDQAYPGLALENRPGVGHHHRGLLVAHVDDPDIIVQAPIEDGSDMPTREGENGVYALDVLQVLRYDMSSVHLSHWSYLPLY